MFYFLLNFLSISYLLILIAVGLPCGHVNGFGKTSSFLINLGILLFCCAVLFQLVTLPVEFNASRRAMRILEERGILGSEELKGARKVLSAAAMTYVAAAVGSLLQLARLLLIRNSRRR